MEFNMNLFGETCTLINRMETPLDIMQDGFTITLQPGENLNIDRSWIRFAKNQHPVMGTDQPFAINHCEYKVGVKDSKDPTSPLKFNKKTGRTQCVSRLDHSHLSNVVTESTGFNPDRVRPVIRDAPGEIRE